ncbi:MAG: hypothetical protein QM776_00230 [Rhodocyclaceae bacterium]
MIVYALLLAALAAVWIYLPVSLSIVVTVFATAAWLFLRPRHDAHLYPESSAASAFTPGTDFGSSLGYGSSLDAGGSPSCDGGGSSCDGGGGSSE